MQCAHLHFAPVDIPVAIQIRSIVVLQDDILDIMCNLQSFVKGDVVSVVPNKRGNLTLRRHH